MPRSSVPDIAAAFLVVLASPCFADVLRVDPSDPTAHATIQGAVDAAVDGDVVLIAEAAGLGSFLIDGKGLTLVVDGAFNDLGQGFNYVRNLSQGQRVTLRGLRGGTLRLRDNLGEVWIDSVQLRQEFSGPFGTGPVLHVDACSSVVVTHCLLSPSSDSAVEPMLAEGSAVTAFDSVFFGSTAGESNNSDGGNGVTLVGAELHAEGCLLRGCDGEGGYSCGFSCGPIPSCGGAGDGGDGISLDPGSMFRSRANVIFEGSAGSPCPGGSDGVPVDNAGGTVVELFGVVRHATVGPTIRAGSAATVFLRGAAGELAFLLVSEDPVQLRLMTPYVGELFLGAGFRIVPAGVLDASGVGLFDYAPPPPPSGEDATVLTLQPVFFDATTGAPTLGGPTRTVVLGAGL